MGKRVILRKWERDFYARIERAFGAPEGELAAEIQANLDRLVGDPVWRAERRNWFAPDWAQAGSAWETTEEDWMFRECVAWYTEMLWRARRDVALYSGLLAGSEVADRA